MWPVLDLRAFLAANWQFERFLRDRRHQVDGTAYGRAHFARSGRSLLYEENGIVTFGAHSGPIEQRLMFRFPNGNRCASIRFRDGRPFHELDLSQGEAAVSYACDPDLYEGRFVAISDNQWQSTWTATGPRKDQEIVTLYTRQG